MGPHPRCHIHAVTSPAREAADALFLPEASSLAAAAGHPLALQAGTGEGCGIALREGSTEAQWGASALLQSSSLHRAVAFIHFVRVSGGRQRRLPHAV